MIKIELFPNKSKILTRLFMIVTAVIGIIALMNCERIHEPTEKDEPLNIPRIYSITELLDEPRRGLRINILYNGYADGFDIQRKVKNSSFQNFASMGPSTSENHQDSYDDWDVDRGIWYVYRVRAYKDDKRSDWSYEDGAYAPGRQYNTLSAVEPVADSYIDESWPNNNYGNENVLLITNDGRIDIEGNEARKSYIKFSLNHIPEYATWIDNAIIRFFTIKDLSVSGTEINGGIVMGPWYESSITWNTKPTEVNGIGLNLSVNNDGNPFELDVSQPLRDWVFNGVPNNGIVLYSVRNKGQAILVSREHAESIRPKLTITYEW